MARLSGQAAQMLRIGRQNIYGIAVQPLCVVRGTYTDTHAETPQSQKPRSMTMCELPRLHVRQCLSCMLGLDGPYPKYPSRDILNRYSECFVQWHVDAVLGHQCQISPPNTPACINVQQEIVHPRTVLPWSVCWPSEAKQPR